MDYHSDKFLRHILICSSSLLAVTKISNKQTNDTAKGKLHVGSSYLCSYTFRGCDCQISWSSTSNSTNITLLYLGTFEYLAQKLCLLHKLEDTAITFPHFTNFINY